jgi:integrase
MSKQSNKRSYGTGSLREENGSWVGRWWHRGRRVTKSLGRVRSSEDRTGLTRKQAEGRLREEMTLFEPGIKSEVTFEQAADAFLRDRELHGLRKVTLSDYRGCLRVHLLPAFGAEKIGSITRRDLEDWKKKVLEEINPRTGKRYAPKSVRNYLGILNSVFSFAEEEGWISDNPMRAVKLPKVSKGKDLQYVPIQDLPRLVEAVPDDNLGRLERSMYWFAATTGLRQSEIRALRWSDIDWTAMKVRVRTALSRDGEITDPKSERGSRSVPLSDGTARVLERHFQSSQWQGQADFVFCHPHTGRPYDRSKLLKRYKAALLRAGVGPTETRVRKSGKRVEVSPYTFHSLRHTFGTQSAATGVPMRTLQEWMGHSDFATTLIYADYAPSESEQVWVNQAFAPVGDSVPNLFQNGRDWPESAEMDRDEESLPERIGADR